MKPRRPIKAWQQAGCYAVLASTRYFLRIVSLVHIMTWTCVAEHELSPPFHPHSSMGLFMPGASWVLLDSAGAATCSAASLFIPVGWELPNPQDAVTELGVSTIRSRQPMQPPRS